MGTAAQIEREVRPLGAELNREIKRFRFRRRLDIDPRKKHLCSRVITEHMYKLRHFIACSKDAAEAAEGKAGAFKARPK